MYIPEKMKLNQYKQVNLPTPRDMFKRYGMLMTPANQYTGDEVLAETELTKMEAIARGETMVKHRQVKTE